MPVIGEVTGLPMVAEVGDRFCIRYGCARRGHRTDAQRCPRCDHPTELVEGYLGSVPIAGEPDTAAIMELTYRREPVPGRSGPLDRDL